MQAVALTIFRIVQFPFQGNIVTIDWSYFITPSAITNDANNVPLFNTPQYKYIGLGLIKDSSLMGFFPSSDPPLALWTTSINMISSSHTDKGKAIVDESSSFSPFEEIYNAIQATSDPAINDHFLVASDHYHMPYWLEHPSLSLDYLSHTLPIDESIMEVISLEEMPWEDYHHRSSFLPPFHMVENHFTSMVSYDIVLNP